MDCAATVSYTHLMMTMGVIAIVLVIAMFVAYSYWG